MDQVSLKSERKIQRYQWSGHTNKQTHKQTHAIHDRGHHIVPGGLRPSGTKNQQLLVMATFADRKKNCKGGFSGSLLSYRHWLPHSRWLPNAYWPPPWMMTAPLTLIAPQTLTAPPQSFIHSKWVSFQWFGGHFLGHEISPQPRAILAHSGPHRTPDKLHEGCIGIYQWS